MCDPITIMMIASSAMQAKASMDQAKRMEQNAARQAKAQYDASKLQAEAEYAEANRKIAEEQEDNLDEQSERVRQSNEDIGSLQASETALSNSSLGLIMFEEMYGEALNITRIDTNTTRALAGLESNKAASEQNYSNVTTQAENQAGNVMAEASAKKTGAILGFASTSLSAGQSFYARQDQIAAIKGVPATKRWATTPL
jgi:hypothetical protein